jgi:hypothetical protein
MSKLNPSTLAVGMLGGWCCLWPLGWACSWSAWWVASAVGFFLASSLLFAGAVLGGPCPDSNC